MTKVCVTYKCIDGGYGWGETGAINKIIFYKNASEEYYQSHAPGGWEVKKIEVIND